MARLTPIENPRNPFMKLAYWLTKRKFGKVISSLKTLYVRMPLGFGMWIDKMTSLEKQLAIPEELMLLIRIQVAQLNSCSFCIDIGKAQAIASFEHQEKFFRVREFEHSTLFTEEERLALRFATELTQQKRVTDKTFALCRETFSEKVLLSIAWTVSSEHVYNLMNLAFALESDGLCALQAPLKSKILAAEKML